MSRYRRANTAGSTYFFTVVAHRRQTFLCDDDVRGALRAAIHYVRQRHAFRIDAWVLLPDHLHCMWTLPPDDADFSVRWNVIKRGVALACGNRLYCAQWISASRRKHRESSLWQRRFSEHQIRDEPDFEAHVDYVHFNPVKHGYVRRVVDWPYSSFHRYGREGRYARDWGDGPIDEDEFSAAEPA